MKIVITGGAGFVGTNVALAYAAEGAEVVVIDNMSRTRENLPLLDAAGVLIVEDDLIYNDFTEHFEGASLVVHAAAQAAVTHSLADPTMDFYDNAQGTLNVLEAARKTSPMPHVIYLSTNKVYGPLLGNTSPISEAAPLDPCTPYGCSKATGDIYARDWHRIYGVPTTVFRMSCIYGGHQYGDTHQGWAAHFMRSALGGREIVVYGDGTQVRDLLHVEDLIAAIRLTHQFEAYGVYNLGGGPTRAISVNGLLEWIEAKGFRGRVKYEEMPRPGDQKFYVSNTRKLLKETGWEPRVGLADGLTRLWTWCESVQG